LLGIFALFLGPVILVVMMRSSWWQYQPAELKNHGYLVQPPAHLSLAPAAAIDNRWLILYVVDPSCDPECIDHVTSLRQIHRATGRDSSQLAIVLLGRTRLGPALRSRLESIYPEFQIVTESSSIVLTTLDTVNKAVAAKTGSSSVLHTYILDPRLNVVLAYGVNAYPNDIHKDLKRLLKWSDKENTR